MKTQKTESLPVYSFSKLSLPLSTEEMIIHNIRQDDSWRERCLVLLKYLQSHDLSIMPEALHQRLYMVLTEIVKVLGDNLPDKLTTYTDPVVDISAPLDGIAASVLPRPSIRLPESLVSESAPMGNSLLCTFHWSQLECSPEQLLARADVNFERIELKRLKGQLQFKNQLLAQKQQELQEIKIHYKDQVLESQTNLLEEFTLKEELNEKIKALEEELEQKTKTLIQNQEQINRLKFQLEKRSTIHRINSNIITPVDQIIRANQPTPQENCDDTLTMHSMSRPIKVKKIRRKPSVSAQDNDHTDLTAFETQEGSEPSFRNNDRLFQKRIEDLENQLKTKDEVLAAINTFVDSEGESILGEKSNLHDLLKRCELKQKYKSYCSLAQENAYLKQCMDKLTKSQQFWAKVHGKGELDQSEHKKCLIF